MMDLPSIDEVERSVGGRPKLEERKVRVSFYLNREEAERLRLFAMDKGESISAVIRAYVKKVDLQQL